MNTHNNLKKRRAYRHEESSLEPVPHDNSNHSQPLQARNPYIFDQPPTADVSVNITAPLSKFLDLESSEAQDYLLRLAASSLNLPYQFLLNQKHHQHQRKRPRLNSDVPMATQFPASPAPQVQEKTPLSAHPGQDDGRRFPSFDAHMPGWPSTRLPDCFANFTVCGPCSTFDSSPSYHTVAATTSYNDYDSSRQSMLVDASVQQQEQQHHDSGPYSNPSMANPDTFFDPEVPTAVVQYLPNYPPLQPSRVGVQPDTSREEMIYPVTASRTMNVGLGIQSETQLLSQPRPEALPDAFPVGAGIVAPRYAGFPDYAQPTGHEARRAGTEFTELRQHEAANAQPRLPTARRKPFKDQDQREKTARTRKIGSCIRCRIQRIRCNEDEDEGENAPCLSCKKISTQKVFRMGCLRWKIMEVKLFKPGQVKGHEWTSRWRDSVVDEIGNWDSSELRTIRVTEGYTGKSVQLTVRQFVPQDGDKVNRSWVTRDGSTKSIRIPPYAIVNLDAAKSAFSTYIKTALIECCKRLLGPKEDLLWQTYILAIKTSRDPNTPSLEQKLLQSTLDLWMSVRLTTKSFEIVGEDTLGMPTDLIDDPGNPLFGKIPLPPVMGAQIDSVLIHQVQAQLRRKTLEELQKMICERKTKTWLTQYLVTFILLHNIALITRHDADYARKHGINRRFAREDKVREYDQGANTLLAYFHHCNKSIYPFSSQCRDEELRSLAQLDNLGIQIVKYTRQFAINHKDQWNGLREAKRYEDEYFYVSQLFDEEWAPQLMGPEM